ncbi:MAG: hypothetical protein AB7V43_20370 [Acidimicrobiia bacterium]
MKVTDPRGTEWTIARRWLPRYEGRGLRERWRQHARRRSSRERSSDSSWWDLLNVGDVGDSLSGFLIAIAVIIAALLLIFFGLPLLLALFDVVVVIVMAVVGVISRVVFRRPWSIDARSSTGERRSIEVVGLREGRRAIASLRDDIASGRTNLDR